jgi:hypothetical protein
MLYWVSSPATCLASPRTAHFEAEYAAIPCGARDLCPAVDEIHTMLPPVPCDFMCTAQHCIVEKTPIVCLYSQLETCESPIKTQETEKVLKEQSMGSLPDIDIQNVLDLFWSALQERLIIYDTCRRYTVQEYYHLGAHAVMDVHSYLPSVDAPKVFGNGINGLLYLGIVSDISPKVHL